AERSGDDDLAGAIIERWIAAGAKAEERRELFVALADRRRAMSDRDAEARAIVRALRLGAPPGALADAIVQLENATLSQDGALFWLEARARVLDDEEDPGAAAAAWRELGAALWDLAGDRGGAVEAWLRAAKIAPNRGYFTLASDVTRFAGPAYAFDCLSELVDRETDPAASGAIAAEAARAGLVVGEAGRAFDLVVLALERYPEHTEALEIAEDCALASGRVLEMSGLYDAMGARALGRFGRRAAHYRGARFFEHHGDAERALKHAGDAFVAVPSEGAALVLLERVADRAGNRPFAVRTLEQVAELSRGPGARAGWLLRAAQLTDGDDEGLRQRVDCLLRAVLLVPDAGTLSLLADAAGDLLRVAPEEFDALAVRVSNAIRMLAARLEGPEGARTALALARLSLRLFEDVEGAVSALERSLAIDGAIEEYESLLDAAPALARAPSAARVMDAALARIEQPYSNVGAAALKLLAAMAQQRGDHALRDRLILRAAVSDPDDASLVRAADDAARRLGDAELSARFDKAVPPSQRGEVFRVHARERAMAGEYDEAIDAMERARVLFGPEERSGVESEIRTLYGSAGRASDLERRTLARAEDESFQPRDRADRYTEVAQRCEERGELGSAASLLRKAAELDPGPLARWSALERAAELARRTDVRIMALREIEKRVDADARPAVLRRLARALEDAGQAPAAIAILEEVLDLHPDDEASDRAVEAMIVSSGDYERLAEHLAGRTARLAREPAQRDSLRAVRLRRVAILEQRLGRVEEACGELEELLREWPENDGALRYLADLYERTGQTHRAAPLWKHLSALAQGSETQTELELHAVTALRDAGDLRGALALVKQLLEREPLLVDAMVHRVEFARALEDDHELGAALEAAALYGGADEATRADLWVDAAQAAARVGDSTRSLERARKA
ncbi:MAG TPA: tetratricopeptide repeat protein, partial [Polyangiaceae bacterium]|nr:tetratricopeptide repeat protein [Polyangiaceae bacterium]